VHYKAEVGNNENGKDVKQKIESTIKKQGNQILLIESFGRKIRKRQQEKDCRFGKSES